ncbi:MAG: hypothetical protein KDJ65_12200 [Anaerolineae bacterium]|nr:hypothetical protein [Anaerolineae bacterium]
MTAERVAGTSGLSILCAASTLAFVPDPNQPIVSVLGASLSSLGLNVLASVLQQRSQHLLAQPSNDELERLAQLASVLERDIRRNAKLRIEIGEFLDNYGAFRIAEEVVRGNPTLHGWLLVQIYTDVTQYRTDFDRIHQAIADLKASLEQLRPSFLADDSIRIEILTGSNYDEEISSQPEHLLTPISTVPPATDLEPFGDLGRITSPDRFFDRKNLLDQIFKELDRGGNISLVGESKIGKSSVLSMVCTLGPAKLKLPAEAFAYLNMQLVENEDDFYEALCEKLGIETCRSYKLARALQGKRHILCLDEIEITKERTGFSMNLRSHLRGLADGSEAPLKLIIASRSPLSDLFPDSPELDSPLDGICRRLEIGPFTPEAARTFIQHRLQRTGVTFTTAEIDILLKHSQCHPAELQHAAADLYEYHRSRRRR